jgi:hypothetical protein
MTVSLNMSAHEEQPKMLSSPGVFRSETASLVVDNNKKSMNGALHSAFDAAGKLDTFLQEPHDEDCSIDDVADYNSITSELCRLQESEDALRRELEGIDMCGDTDTLASQPTRSLSSSDEDLTWAIRSLASPTKKTRSRFSGIPTMLPASPGSNQKSKGSLDISSLWSPSPTSSQKRTKSCQDPSTGYVGTELDRDFDIHVKSSRIHSSSFGLEHQITDAAFRKLKDELDAVLLRAQQDDVILDHYEFSDDDFEFFDEPDTNKGVMHRLANMLFGRTEYTIKHARSKCGFKRSVQGSSAIGLAAGVAVVNTFAGTPHLSVALAILPFMASLLQTKLPNKTSETTIALSILAIQLAVSCAVNA